MCGKGSQGGGGVGALGWGGLAPSQQQTIQASPEAMGWYRQAMQLGQQAVSRPYQQFGTQASDFVAQLNAQQQAAQQGLQGIASATQPYASQGAGMMAGAGQANAAQLASTQYMNPYMSQVVDPVKQAMQQQQGQQLSQQQTEAIRGGAFGGERAGLQRAMLRGQQNLATGQALSPLYQQGWGQALGAAQTDLARQMQAGQGLIGAGLATQQASLGAGTLGQQTEQAGIDALRQQFNQQQMWPYMQAQFLGGLAGGLGPLMGQQTYQAQAMSPFGAFFADGGTVDGDSARMGGAVIDAIPGQDYYAGGIAPSGYAKGGVSYANSDIGDILRSHEAMYGKEPSEYEKMPTGQIQAAKGLEAPNLTSEEQKKGGLKDITGAAKDLFGIGKDIYGMFSSKSTDQNADEKGGMGSRAESDSSSDWMKTLGKLGLSAAANYFLPGSGFAVGAATRDWATGGAVDRHGYATLGGVRPEDDIFDRGIIGAESAGRQFDRYGRTLTSPKGAEGISQIMPGTAPEAAKLAGLPYDPARVRSDEEYNRALGKAYYNEQLRKFGTPELAAAAYNAGPGRLQKALRQSQATGRDVMSFLPAETQAYVPKVMGRGVTAPGGGLDAARSDLAASRREIPLGDPRRSLMATDLSERRKIGAAPTPEGVTGGLDSVKGLLTEQNVVPGLVGLGTAIAGMMGAKTVSPGAAIAAGLGEGLAGGAKQYGETAKSLEERRKLHEEAGTQRALGQYYGAETLDKMRELPIWTDPRTGLRIITLEGGRAAPLSDWLNGDVVGVPMGFTAMADFAENLRRQMKGEMQPGYAPEGGWTGAGPDADKAIETAKNVPTTGAPTAPPAPGTPTAAPISGKPSILAPAGINYSPSSNDFAKQEARAIGQIGGETAEASSKSYKENLDKAALAAQPSKIFNLKAAELVSRANAARGLDTPGAQSKARSEIINGLNTLARTFGVKDANGNIVSFGQSDNTTALLDKIRVMNAEAVQKNLPTGGLGVMEAIISAMPGSEQPPEAAAWNAASGLVTTQMPLDRKTHADYYGTKSQGLYQYHDRAFNRDNPTALYDQQKEAWSQLIMAPGGADIISKIINDREHWPASRIDAYFRKGGYPDGMSRYFVEQ